MASGPFQLDGLNSGGLITNYHCSSSCAHCLYGCSPRRSKDYIYPATVRKNLKKISSLGCRSIHIGGGEPLLHPDKLYPVLDVINDEGVFVEYIETNSSWFRDRDSCLEVLNKLQKKNISTLLISISPFHNEHIAFNKVKGLISACREAGMAVFPWIAEFSRDLESFDTAKKHAMSEYFEKFGDSYLSGLMDRYGLVHGGRAIKTFDKQLERIRLEDIIRISPPSCYRLSDTNHFHIDLYGNYIPGLCPGLAIQCDDLGEVLDPAEYPLLNALHRKGIKGLYELAAEKHGFATDEAGYSSECHLCYEVRRHLTLNVKMESKELQPVEFYEELR